MIYIIDFSHDNCVFLYQGAYNNKNPKHTITSQGIIYTPATLITSTDNIFDLAKKVEMDVETLKQDISTHIQHLKKNNTLEEWENFNAKKNGPLKIIDENIDFSDIAFYINDTLYTALFSNPETTLLHNFDTYKLEIHALLFQTPTKENQQQLFNYLTT